MRDNYFLQQHQNIFSLLNNNSDNQLKNNDLIKDVQVVNYSERIYKMTTPFLNKRYESIISQAQERNTNDTITLFKLIVQNIRCLLNTGINLHLLITLVRFLSQEKKIDTDNLETYLKETHLDDMAQYLGELIISIFQFDVDAVVFMKKKAHGTSA